MDVVSLALVPILIIFIFLFYSVEKSKKKITILASAAKKLGLKDRAGNWFTGVRFTGKLNNLDVTLAASFEKNEQDILTLILELPASHQLEIRRKRHFLNFDFTNWFFGRASIKVKEFSDNNYEVFSDDVFLVRRIFSDPYIKPLLQLCIANQTSSLMIQCSALHHEACWNDNRRCAVFECTGSVGNTLQVKN